MTQMISRRAKRDVYKMNMRSKTADNGGSRLPSPGMQFVAFVWL